MRFHALTDNTADYLPGSNNFPYGAPPKLEDNEMDYGEPEGLRPSEYPTPLHSGDPPGSLKGKAPFYGEGRRGCFT